mgnify:FL=1|tara:strand:+ start:1715 stop:2653 length:939 start_codon:yes stop_codon:yes gene_type:complete
MKIGLVPMSAKPYHRGHHYLVETASSENDKVLLFVSISDRSKKGQIPIYGEDMQQIWREDLEAVMPNNVEIFYGGSPVRKVLETLINAEEQLNLVGTVENVYNVYSDAEDTQKNYLIKKTPRAGGPATSTVDRYFPNLYLQGYVSFAGANNPDMFTRGGGAPNVSGTAMRSMLGNEQDKDSFMSNLPDSLSQDAKERIYSRLRNKINESKKRPQKDTQEYSTYLEELMDELKYIKSGYESRKKAGRRYRKEASKLQDAYSELRRLRNKNNKVINAQKINESINQNRYVSNIEVDNNDDFSIDSIRAFFRKFK